MNENKINGRQLIVLDPSLLFQMGRTLPVPFQIKYTEVLNCTKVLNCIKVLRLLPQRRIVCQALMDASELQGNKSTIVKIFFHPDKAENDFNNEITGYELLKKTGILIPQRLSYGSFTNADKTHKAYCVLYEQIQTQTTLEDVISFKPDAKSEHYIKQLMTLVAAMHNSHVQQIDLHLNNFLVDQENEKIYTLDCGDVSELSSSVSKQLNQIHKNLADVLSQLPIIYDQFLETFLHAYQQQMAPGFTINQKQIEQHIQKWRHWRIRKYLQKAARNCSEFRYEKSWSLLKVVQRDYSSGPWLSFYRRLDELTESSERLKDGNTATVALAECAEQKVVIKRYNIKNFRHRLSRFWRPTRAWKTWQNAHQLHVLGIKTPKPIAVIEQRSGWFRGKAFYLSEYEPAPDALSVLSEQESVSKNTLQDFEQLFMAMILSRMSHGDLKANNILLTENGLTLIDLDAMQFHSNDRQFKKAFRRDLKRFIKNWPETSTVHRQFSELVTKILQHIGVTQI